MNGEKLKSWEEFENIALEEISKTKEMQQREGTSGLVDYPLFRGHGSAKWHLKTTLERIKDEQVSLREYHYILKIVHKAVESCTGKRWDLDTETDLGSFVLPAYEFMAYLRHNGFPSPLLDWTRSPYIAAYFAFTDTTCKKNSEDYVSIFVYRESCGHGKGWCGGKPYIRALGPTIVTDAKHFLQQSQYSICVKEQNSEVFFANHEEVEPEEDQDVLLKYDIPFSEQKKALEKLDLINITAYSLFTSERSLMETLALREIILKYK